MTFRQTLRRALLAAAICAGLPTGVVHAADAPAVPRDSVVVPAVPQGRYGPGTAPLPVPEQESDSEREVLEQVATEDIELQMNADVVKWIGFFTGNGRSTFERWMKRSGRYMELFRNVLQKEGMPPDLVHLVYVESGFNVNARSYAAAVGPWQFLASTSRLFGLHVNQWVDERKDPEKSTVAAARYLKHLFGIFGDWPLALAAYNAGEGRVLRAMKAQGTTNYWNLRLPQQTEDYVPKFMAALAISRDPARYGFTEIEFDEPMAFDELAFKGAVDLRSIAKLAGCTVTELQALNPAFRGATARGANGVTTLRVPAGTGEALMGRIAEGEKLPAADLTVRHKVQRGETLAGIAKEYSVSARELARVNGISKAKPLKRGRVITIPASFRAPTPEVLDPAVDPRASTAYVPERRIGLPARVNGNSETLERTSHTVRRGQTLASVAAIYGVSSADLRQWNALKSDRLRPGQRLRVRGVAGPVAAAPAPAADASVASLTTSTEPIVLEQSPAPVARRHTVKAGESLTSIASQYGVSVAELREWNRITSRKGTVQRGQKLTIRAADAAVAANEAPADLEAPATEEAKRSDAKPARATTHTVRRGETLSAIARRHGVSVEALRKANQLQSSAIQAGQRLRLPG